MDTTPCTKFTFFSVCISFRYSLDILAVMIIGVCEKLEIAYKEIVDNESMFLLLISTWVHFRNLRVRWFVWLAAIWVWQQADNVWLLVRRKKSFAFVHKWMQHHLKFALSPDKLNNITLLSEHLSTFLK